MIAFDISIGLEEAGAKVPVRPEQRPRLSKSPQAQNSTPPLSTAACREPRSMRLRLL